MRVRVAAMAPAMATPFRRASAPPPLLQELDAIEPRLSYQGWQKAVAEIEESYIEGGMPAPWNDSILQNNLRPGAVRTHAGCVVSTTITLSIAELLCL